MNSQEILSLYETVAAITDQMVVAARNGDWERLALLESHCASQVAILKQDESPAPLTAGVRERKATIIKKILADDREIRNITEPWMAQLSAMIDSTSAERKLSKAYGANSR
ncbi:MAG TPA: flagellar protein FliT [Noviherbaspirillum sp.]|jgi:flagellar protein FliT|nr:flagellar protein FliT [Noviherbaspirillum sp.]